MRPGELVLAAVAYSFDHPTLLSDRGHRERMKAALESALPRILGMREGTISDRVVILFSLMVRLTVSHCLLLKNGGTDEKH